MHKKVLNSSQVKRLTRQRLLDFFMNTVFANTRLNFPQVKRLTNCGLSDIFINIGFNF